jgi:hypothetical protein
VRGRTVDKGERRMEKEARVRSEGWERVNGLLCVECGRRRRKEETA